MRIAAIQRYPVKGLSPEPMPSAELVPGRTLVNDRRWAIENGPSGFDTRSPAWLPKSRFLVLMRDERLAALRTRLDDRTGVLVIGDGTRELVRGDLTTREGRLAVEAFFRRHMAKELRGPPKVLESGGHSFSDVAAKVVSLINLETVRALARTIGAAVDPLRFRGNVHVDGLAPSAELGLVGARLTAPSGARLEVVKRIRRCAAVEVDPSTGRRDLDVLGHLMRTHGHADCGVYAAVIAPGRIAPGDVLEIG